MKTAIAPSAHLAPSGPWWRQLNRYHWFVFMVASLAWLFDCLDQQIFILARNSVITALSAMGTDPVLIKRAGTNATALFVAGLGVVAGFIFLFLVLGCVSCLSVLLLVSFF